MSYIIANLVVVDTKDHAVGHAASGIKTAMGLELDLLICIDPVTLKDRGNDLAIATHFARINEMGDSIRFRVPCPLPPEVPVFEAQNIRAILTSHSSAIVDEAAVLRPD
jgi:hypothetical protein